MFGCFFLQHGKSIARFISYALCAADEALKDANWDPSEQEDKEKTVFFPYMFLMIVLFCLTYVS